MSSTVTKRFAVFSIHDRLLSPISQHSLELTTHSSFQTVLQQYHRHIMINIMTCNWCKCWSRRDRRDQPIVFNHSMFSTLSTSRSAARVKLWVV